MHQTTKTAGTAADDPADEASQFSQLPAALLTQILQLLPQQDRLTRCARVCKSWAEAAAAATVELDVSFDADQRRFQNRLRAVLEPWLEQHAGQLVSLRVGGHYPTAPIRLPSFKLQQLSRLDLERIKVHLTPAAGGRSAGAGALPMLSKMRELRLDNCKISRGVLLQLAQLSSVTNLELGLSPPVRGGGPSADPEAVKRLLQGMSNLERLDLHRPPGGPVEAADIVPVLPAHSLTALTLSQYRVKFPDSASRLANLCELALTAELSLVALASMTLLTKLELDNCLSVSGVDSTICGSLAALRGMRQLQHLELRDSVGPPQRAAEPQACAALTASSQLTCLGFVSEYRQLLPATALRHMFPAGKRLLRLQHLVFDCQRGDGLHAGRITAAELSNLVDACPGLTCLDLTCVLAPDADADALLKLPQQCQHLKVGGRAFGDKAAGVIAQLTQLTSLQWVASWIGGGNITYVGLTYDGLAQLAALHMLDTLFIEDENFSGDSQFSFQCDSVLLKTKAGGKSVSRQLCELLLAAPSSGPWKQQLLEQQNKVADMQDSLEQQEQQQQQQGEEDTTVQDSLRDLSCSTCAGVLQ